MGLCPSGDIFQTKVDEILSDIKGVKTYIKNILVLDRGSFYLHIDHLRVIFARLHAAGLKSDSPKCSFRFK